MVSTISVERLALSSWLARLRQEFIGKSGIVPKSLLGY
jgi:hypothetical protein